MPRNNEESLEQKCLLPGMENNDDKPRGGFNKDLSPL
jgi:hypothetical protein